MSKDASKGTPRRYDHTFTCGNIRAKVWVNGPDDISCSFAKLYMGGATYYVGQDDLENLRKCVEKVEAWYANEHPGPDGNLFA